MATEGREQSGRTENAGSAGAGWSAGRATGGSNAEQGTGQEGEKTGQGQHGEEYGIYGRGASEGGRYADEGDSVEDSSRDATRSMADQDTSGLVESQTTRPSTVPPEGRKIKVKGAKRADRLNQRDATSSQTGAQEDEALEEFGNGLNDDRMLEGESALDAQRGSHGTWKAPRESTFNQNTGEETMFGQHTAQGPRGEVI